MERSEPSLVPQWLKSSGSISSSGSSHLQLHSDNHSTARHTRNQSSASSDHDIGRTPVSDRSTSAYFRRSSSSNGTTHARSYSSFTKGRHDRDWEKDINGYHDKERNLDYADSLDNMLPNFDKDLLQRSQSLITGKQGDTWPRMKARSDSNVVNKSNHTSGNVPNEVRAINKSTFERNFPSLAAEESQVAAETGRLSSPGLSTAIQSLPAGTSTMTSGDGWTSALAEVPVNMGNSGTGVAATQTVSPSSASIIPTKTTGLNMAETVAQGPIRARTPPLLNVGSQRLEELAIKQSRQLIPMTPSMPKTLALSPSEKSKSKTGQHQYSLLSPSNSRGGTARSDSLKMLNESRLQILKTSRELNSFPSTAKETLSPNGSKLVTSPISGNPSTASAPFRSSSHVSGPSNAERNPTSFHVTTEKRTTAQAQSRNDFFNLLKKKSSQNSPSSVSDPGPAVSPSFSKSVEDTAEDGSITVTMHGGNVPTSSETSVAGLPTENRSEMIHNGDSYGGSHQYSSNGEKHPNCRVFLGGEEEETAFLRSLGWDENAGEDEGLTEEEISNFYQEYPSAKLSQGMQPKLPFNSEERS